MDLRHLLRIYIIQRLFEIHFSKELDHSTVFEESDDIMLEYSKIDMDKANEIVEAVDSRIKGLDEIIKQYAPEWPIENIVKTDLEILRLAIYEGFISKAIPKKVAINEGIELARQFGGEGSRKFVSGVLGSLYEIKDENQITKYLEQFK